MVISSDEDEGDISKELVDKCISDDEKSEEEFRKYPEFDENATFGEGFKAGCKPLIGLDGCFLKGYYEGQLLSTVAQDGNQHFYVIVIAVVEQESRDTWSWFLTNLLADIGQYSDNGWNFISDQQKRMNEDAWAWLKRFKPDAWSKAGFSDYPKNGNLLNNTCEQFNSKIVKFRVVASGTVSLICVDGYKEQWSMYELISVHMD
ncbi:hypothetical protein CRG98_039979 [Punica granatum]|uniref:MULE transposase domain-containing protein n=1 Tax=Punica granatum TaxID=22663 RepID=A0A2I0I6Q6_PUNGR|nr:hypothetical protein CRG98_039979 [Punica granatum]